AGRARGSPRLRGLHDRLDDRYVSGASAEVAGKHVDDLVPGRRAAAVEQVQGREEDPGCAKAALEGVVRPKRLLERAPRQPLDRLDLGAVGLDREQEARADCYAVEAYGASAADAVLATHVRTGQPERVAQEV